MLSDIETTAAEDGTGPAVVLTEPLIKLTTGQFDVALPTTLVLHHLNIAALNSAVLERCVSLTTLDLSHNSLSTTSGISVLAEKLMSLDLRHNKIKTLPGVSALKSLQLLKLEGNRVQEMDEISNLTELKSLRLLSLRDKDGGHANPVCEETDYVPTMNKWFPNVRCVDGHYFCKEDMNPKKLEMPNDEEYTLPKSVPWVTENNFKSIVFDPSKVGAAQEKNFRAVLADGQQILAKAQERKPQTQTAGKK